MKDIVKIFTALNVIFIIILVLNFRNSMVLFNDYNEEDSFEKWINDYMSNVVPGLGDLGVPAYLFAGEKYIESKILSKEAANVLLSDRISLDRRLPDPRHSQCQNIWYDIDNLPTASVIIPFHNEAWSLLLRTVHSVLRETPVKLLKEIILVDDDSHKEELKGVLSYYIETRLPSYVYLIRLSKRQGLIRARLEGVKHARGDVIIVLDAHCEVIKQWIEPLLNRIKEKRNVVAVSVVDAISSETLEYHIQSNQTLTGGFTWRGEFRFIIDKPNIEVLMKECPTSPIPTPTMMGTIFAVDKKYFWKLGSYDDQMIGWGGENLEMSFRTWQCGGSIEVIPCSRVGHLFREFFPYKMPSNKSIAINLARAVSVWMDDYSRFFYLYNKNVESVYLTENFDESKKMSKRSPNCGIEYRTLIQVLTMSEIVFGDQTRCRLVAFQSVGEPGNIHDRLELRKRLKCKSFKWYLENVYPEKFVPDENVTAHGRLVLAIRQLCLTLNLDVAVLKLSSCRNEPDEDQYFSLTNWNLLRTEFHCLTVVPNSTKVVMNSCENSLEIKKWKLYENGSLVHLSSTLCLEANPRDTKQKIKANSCNGSPYQIWKFDSHKYN